MWINLLLLSLFIVSPKLLAQPASAVSESDDYQTQNHKVAPIPGGVIPEACDLFEEVDNNGTFEIRIPHAKLTMIDKGCVEMIAKLDAKLKKEVAEPDSFDVNYMKSSKASSKLTNDLKLLDSWGLALKTKYKSIFSFSKYTEIGTNINTDRIASEFPNSIRVFFFSPEAISEQAIDIKDGQQKFFSYSYDRRYSSVEEAIGPHSANGSGLPAAWAKLGAGKYYYKSKNYNDANGVEFKTKTTNSSLYPTHRLGNIKNTDLLPVKLRFNPGWTPKRIIVRVRGKDIFDSGMVSSIWNDKEISIVTSFDEEFAWESLRQLRNKIKPGGKDSEMQSALKNHNGIDVSETLLETLKDEKNSLGSESRSIKYFISTPSLQMKAYYQQMIALTPAQLCMWFKESSHNFTSTTVSVTKKKEYVEYIQASCKVHAALKLKEWKDDPKNFFSCIASTFTDSGNRCSFFKSNTYIEAKFNKWVNLPSTSFWHFAEAVFPGDSVFKNGKHGNSTSEVVPQIFAGIYLMPAYRGELVSNNNPNGTISIPDIKIQSTKDVIDIFVYSISPWADAYTLENVR